MTPGRIYYCRLPSGRLGSYTEHSVESLLAGCEDLGDCRLWRGYVGNGTPLVYDFASDKMVSVRRLIREILGQTVQTGNYYPSSCGDPLCVAPEHTISRTQRLHAKAMNRALSESPATEQIRRAKISTAKRLLSDEQISEIISSDEDGPTVAARLGVSRSTVSKYRRGERGVYRAANPWAALLMPGAAR